MLIRFFSKAGADVLMLGAHAQSVLQALGRDPTAEGIFLPEQIPAALAQLARAEPAPVIVVPPAGPQVHEPVEADSGAESIDLARRAWPVRALLQRALDARESVLWQAL